MLWATSLKLSEPTPTPGKIIIIIIIMAITTIIIMIIIIIKIIIIMIFIITIKIIIIIIIIKISIIMIIIMIGALACQRNGATATAAKATPSGRRSRRACSRSCRRPSGVGGRAPRRTAQEKRVQCALNMDASGRTWGDGDGDGDD